MEDSRIREILSANGLRPTLQRIAVYGYLCEHRTHPTAERIYAGVLAENPTFSYTTVYNSLHALEQAGLVRSLSIDNTQQRYDAAVFDHGHFRCRVCGEVTDFDLPAEIASLCPAAHTPEQLDVFITGVCPRCK